MKSRRGRAGSGRSTGTVDPVTDLSSSVAASDRHVPFGAGAFNVRDLGGLHTMAGETLRRGVAYRADGLHRLPTEEIERLAALGVRTVVDLRSTGELDVAASIAADGIVVLHLPVLRDVWSSEGLVDSASQVDAVTFLVERYLEMLEDGADAIAAIFELLAQPDARPLAFHCSAGKDRTGVIAALLLSLVGVPDDDIADDYTTSAVAMEKLVEWIRSQRPEAADAMAKQPAVFLSCPPEAMHVFLARLRERWGSVEAYLESVGVEAATRQSVRAAFLP